MLGKLFKHEIKATSRLFLPLYLALLVFAFINRLLNPILQVNSSNTSVSINLNVPTLIGSFSMVIYFALIIGIFVMALVITVQRFYKNLLGDEGYLMFTLPVKTWMHILSKLLIAMFWVISSFIITICSIIILIDDKGIIEQLFQLIKIFTDMFGYSTLIMIPVFIIIFIATNITMIYAAMSLGHLFEDHRILASFGMYCALYFACQVINALYLLLLKNTLLESLFTSTTPAPQAIISFILSFSLLLIIYTIGYFALTNGILTKRLNLE